MLFNGRPTYHAQLMREREELKQSLQAATSEVLAKTGEVKIVRANQAQHEKEWMRRMIAHEKQQEAQVAKAQAELAKTIHERNSLQTLNQFEKQDVREETLKQRQTRRQKETNADAGNANLTTPRKNRVASYRDGFDDGEIMAISPSRSGGRSRGGTPRMGGKRKRRGVDDSPVPMLQLSQSPRPAIDREESQQSLHEKLSTRFNQNDRRYEVGGDDDKMRRSTDRRSFCN